MPLPPLGMILAAGFGTRLRPLSFVKPKPVMEVLTKPIIFYTINKMVNAGIKDVVINLHHDGEKIKSCLERYNFGCRLHYIFEKTILGTAGGLSNALRRLAIKNRQMVVVHGDIFCEFDYAPYLANEDFCTLICDEDRVIDGYQGNVGVDRDENVVNLGRFYQSSKHVSRRGFFTGIHILSPSAVDTIKQSDSKCLVSEIYPSWLAQGKKLRGVIRPILYDDLGTKERLLRTNLSLLGDESFLATTDYRRQLGENDKPVYIHDSASIAGDAKLFGPSIVGSHAKILSKATIGPRAIVGERTLVHPHAIIRNSVVMSETIIEKDEHLDCGIALHSVRVIVRR